jgi:hypothetical protein
LPPFNLADLRLCFVIFFIYIAISGTQRVSVLRSQCEIRFSVPAKALKSNSFFQMPCCQNKVDTDFIVAELFEHGFAETEMMTCDSIDRSM